MPTQKKIDQVAAITEDLGANAGFFVIDYRGLTVKAFSTLRKNLRANGAKCSVYKNNLVNRALVDSSNPDMGELLTGTNAYVFFEKDPASAGKVIKDFAKENKSVVIKCGLVDGAVCDEATANAIADLPGRDQLLGTILATMLNPMSQIARVIDLIREQKEQAA